MGRGSEVRKPVDLNLSAPTGESTGDPCNCNCSCKAASLKGEPLGAENLLATTQDAMTVSVQLNPHG